MISAVRLERYGEYGESPLIGCGRRAGSCRFLALACRLLPAALCLVFPAASLLMAQTVSDTRAELTPTQPHPSAGWPNQGTMPRSAYAGPGACARCHPAIWQTWEKSQMAHAMELASDSQYLRTHPDMSFRHGPYTYHIVREGNRAVYSVSDESHTLSIPLLWAYGVGVVGQTYVFYLNGTYYETEVAYYPVLHRPSIVAGLPDAIPPTLAEAFGLPLASLAARQCISCHTTAAVTSNELHVDTMIRGVTCEACHGPGAEHVARMEKQATAVKGGRSSIFNPATLDPVNLEDFCGECHRSSQLVIREGLHGLDTIHYEPYRLEMSQCWIMTRRITCVTCHDPHQALQRGPAAYDSACLSCHSSRANSRARARRTASNTRATREARDHVAIRAMGSTCPVAVRNCASCHMPECRLPSAPFTMSDHFIRIVGPDDACSKRSPSSKSG